MRNGAEQGRFSRYALDFRKPLAFPASPQKFNVREHCRQLPWTQNGNHNDNTEIYRPIKVSNIKPHVIENDEGGVVRGRRGIPVYFWIYRQ